MAIEDADGILLEIPDIMTYSKQATFRKEKIASPSDGLAISIIICEPFTAPKGIVQLVHGMCEHKERYEPFMEFLAANGFASVIHDHRGHGESVRSAEDLGYFYEGGFTAMIDDIKAVTERVRMEHPDLPLILIGHSMGSMAVRSFAKRYDDMLSGLIICGSPSRNSGAPAGRIIARLYAMAAGKKCRPRLIQRLAFGSFNRRFRHEGSPNAWICSDPEIVRNYDKDPLCNFRFTANGFINLFSLMQDAYSISGWHPRRPDMPVLFISGEDDPCLIDHSRFDHAVNTMRRATPTYSPGSTRTCATKSSTRPARRPSGTTSSPSAPGLPPENRNGIN